MKKNTAVKESEREIYNKGYGQGDIMPDPMIMNKIVEEQQKWIDVRIKRLPKGAKILDIGCGEGVTSFKLAEKGFSVVGIDLSEARIERAREEARRRGLSNIVFYVGDAEYPPFNQESFEGVYCNAILHHLPDVEGDVQRYWKLLKPGGQLFALEPGLLNPYAFIRRKFFPTSVHTPDERPFIPAKFFAIFRSRFDRVEVSRYHINNLAAPIVDKVAGRYWGNLILNITAPVDRILCKIPGIREFAWYLAVWAKK